MTASRVTLPAILAAAVLWAAPSASAQAPAPCGPPVTNAVACENTRPGDAPSTWEVNGAGSSTIQGFATDISVNRGQTIAFKVRTPASAYRLDVYRMGYYGGAGARRVATFTPSARLPQTQPACRTVAATGLVDCGNWAVSASWAVPADAVSGIYFARLVRTDATAGASHVFFVVRDDAGTSDLLFQTADTTWQAYNQFGGNSLYTGNPAGRAYKVSYNRPFGTRGTSAEDWVFNAEYPMVRWLERNGYDVSYSTGVDTDRNGGLLRRHKAFLSVGHDEYWSGPQRANVEAARDAGVNLAFFSGNEVFWKTRWEPSADGANTPYRTLVSYKETHANRVLDPADPPTWTGTWRDARFSPPADGGRPENALTGTIFMVNGGPNRRDSIRVPSEYAPLRFWRNTSVAGLTGGAVKVMPPGTLGYEWDEELDNGFRPPGLMRLSSATYDVGNDKLLDNGSTFGAGEATHNLTLYRRAGGGLVFGAGTVQWSWGLDATHDFAGTPVERDMQQATLNLFADMGAQPATPMSGLAPASASTDQTGPATAITSPGAGTTVGAGAPVAVTGTATDAGGGVVGGVEVSTDDGATWHPATGTASWTYRWIPRTPGLVTLRSRAADDSGNLGAPTSATVSVGTRACPCRIWTDADVPATPNENDATGYEVGLKFRSAAAGFITGLRFYKSAANTGTHTAHLWTATGQRLATATFAGETASGWQAVAFADPVPISAGTTYVASYTAPNGHYAEDEHYFSTSGVDSPPLEALRSGVDGPNGVYGPPGGFPTSVWLDSNYWVDVDFATSAADQTPPSVAARAPAAGATGVPATARVTASFSEPVDPASVSLSMRGPGGAAVAGAVAYDGPSRTATFTPAAALSPSTAYAATVAGARDLAGNAMTAPDTWSFTTAASGPGPGPGPACPCSIWPASAAPQVPADGDTGSVELGVRFRSDVAGSVTGIRFYKSPQNTGTHTGTLWTATGTQLRTGTFAGETASGWQTLTFATPVAIQAGTTYVASYHAPNGRYAADEGFFTAAGVDTPPLHALRSGVDGPNGTYAYGSATAFPSSTYQATNYWIDVIFTAP